MGRVLIWRITISVLSLVLLGMSSWTTLRQDQAPAEGTPRPAVLCVPSELGGGYLLCEGFVPHAVREFG